MEAENWNTVTSLFPGYAIKLGVSLLCGVLLGIERERKEKPAGLRTLVLITVGSTLYMIVSELIPRITLGPEGVTQADPSRVAAQVVSGIGFLGAGTIIQSRGSVHGLTTAAVIWVAAAIGLCVGIGFPVLAVGFTVVVLAALTVLTPARDLLLRRGPVTHIDLLVRNDVLRVQHVRSVLEASGAQLIRFDLGAPHGDDVELHISYNASEGASPSVFESLLRLEGVRGEPAVKGMGSS